MIEGKWSSHFQKHNGNLKYHIWCMNYRIGILKTYLASENRILCWRCYRCKVTIQKASLTLKECVDVLRMTWGALNLSTRIQLQMVQVRYDDDDYGVTDGGWVFGSLVYDVCEVCGWLVWVEMIWLENFDFSLFEN